MFGCAFQQYADVGCVTFGFRPEGALEFARGSHEIIRAALGQCEQHPAEIGSVLPVQFRRQRNAEARAWLVIEVHLDVLGGGAIRSGGKSRCTSVPPRVVNQHCRT